MTEDILQIPAYNNQVIQLMDERAAENCDRMVNAYALIDANEHRYDTLITNLTADQTEWRQRYEAHQRTAKRVSVKSSGHPCLWSRQPFGLNINPTKKHRNNEKSISETRPSGSEDSADPHHLRQSSQFCQQQRRHGLR